MRQALAFKPIFSIEEGLKRTFNEYIDEVNSYLNESVSMRLRADVPIGAFISGGIDSTLIIKKMTETTRKQYDVFGADFPGTDRSEKKYIKKNGESFWGFVTITPIKDSADNLSYFIAQLYDITKRKKTERKLARYAEELKELNTSKDKFFSIISHDLRSPFNALLGISEYTSQFFDELSETEIKDSVINMHNSAKKVYELMQNLLEWTQVQTGRLKVEKSKIDLCEISNEILELYRDTAANKKVKLDSEISCTINLYADRYMIETVIRNLISNAIKFTNPGGTVSLNAAVNGVLVEITVLDTGVGIAKENQNKLFKIDAQYRRDGTANEKGTGLGLIFCKEFVEKNNGTIRIESKENEGSKFTFTVPLYKNSSE
ncbi:MAG: PAS domain S-box protein [Bacteroidetes bacterium]|nr:PAS domain S-box protein [Bacteroidota bacterium]